MGAKGLPDSRVRLHTGVLKARLVRLSRKKQLRCSATPSQLLSHTTADVELNNHIRRLKRDAQPSGKPRLENGKTIAPGRAAVATCWWPREPRRPPPWRGARCFRRRKYLQESPPSKVRHNRNKQCQGKNITQQCIAMVVHDIIISKKKQALNFESPRRITQPKLTNAKYSTRDTKHMVHDRLGVKNAPAGGNCWWTRLTLWQHLTLRPLTDSPT